MNWTTRSRFTALVAACEMSRQQCTSRGNDSGTSRRHTPGTTLTAIVMMGNLGLLLSSPLTARSVNGGMCCEWAGRPGQPQLTNQVPEALGLDDAKLWTSSRCRPGGRPPLTRDTLPVGPAQETSGSEETGDRMPDRHRAIPTMGRGATPCLAPTWRTVGVGLRGEHL